MSAYANLFEDCALCGAFENVQQSHNHCSPHLIICAASGTRLASGLGTDNLKLTAQHLRRTIPVQAIIICRLTVRKVHHAYDELTEESQGL